MNYYEIILNKTYGPSGERLLLPATDADKEIDRLQSIIKAQSSTIAELQEVIRIISGEVTSSLKLASKAPEMAELLIEFSKFIDGQWYCRGIAELEHDINELLKEVGYNPPRRNKNVCIWLSRHEAF